MFYLVKYLIVKCEGKALVFENQFLLTYGRCIAACYHIRGNSNVFNICTCSHLDFKTAEIQLRSVNNVSFKPIYYQLVCAGLGLYEDFT